MPTPTGQGSLLQSREQVQHSYLMGETLKEDQGGVGHKHTSLKKADSCVTQVP